MSKSAFSLLISEPFVTLRPKIFSNRDCLRIAGGLNGVSFPFIGLPPEWIEAFPVQSSSHTVVTVPFESVAGNRSWPAAPSQQPFARVLHLRVELVEPTVHIRAITGLDFHWLARATLEFLKDTIRGVYLYTLAASGLEAFQCIILPRSRSCRPAKLTATSSSSSR